MHVTTTRGTWRHLVALLAVPLLAFSACGDDDDEGDVATDTTQDTAEECPVPDDIPAPPGSLLAEAQAQGSIDIGYANEVPYGFEGEDGEPTGEAPELAEAILCELGIPNVEGTVVDFGALIPGVTADRFDIIAAGMFITPERAAQIAFADPEYCGTSAFAVPEGNPQNITDFASVAANDEVILGVLNGAVEQGYALDSGVPEDRVQPYQTTPDLVDALTAGRIDAFALTEVTVVTQVEDLQGFEATEGFVPVIDGEEQLGCGAFGFRPEDQATVDAFNQVLHRFQEEGRVLEIIGEFGFSEASVERAESVTAEELANPGAQEDGGGGDEG